MTLEEKSDGFLNSSLYWNVKCKEKNLRENKYFTYLDTLKLTVALTSFPELDLLEFLLESSKYISSTNTINASLIGSLHSFLRTCAQNIQA